MATRRQGSIYQRISDLEATVEKLERRLTRKQAIKHEPVAFLCKTATTFAAKSGGGALGKGEIWIYEVDKTDVQFDTAEKNRLQLRIRRYQQHSVQRRSDRATSR